MIKILLIEDDVELALLLQSSLAHEEIEAHLAFTPLEGLTRLQDESFDALVLDLSYLRWMVWRFAVWSEGRFLRCPSSSPRLVAI